mgnify:FL=1
MYMQRSAVLQLTQVKYTKFIIFRLVTDSPNYCSLLIAGYDVTGVYMQNWSEHDEQGYCSGEQDYMDAQKVADKLQIPLKRVGFEKEYWNHVFRFVVYVTVATILLLYHNKTCYV